MQTHITLGKWTKDKLNQILYESSEIAVPCKRIDFISGHFLGIDYKEKTLIGSLNIPEKFVIDLEGVDCFTFIDYIEALRLSDSFTGFINNTAKVRYRNGSVTFENRNHFFTDWREFNSEFVDDITEKLSSKKYKKTLKILNLKEDGTYFLPGIWPQHRQIKYIPSENIDNSVLTKLKSGDYAGIYSDMPGLDVSHVGIIIKKGDSVFLRHASSELKYRKVIDQDFRDYVTCKAGLIVLRPKNTV